MKFQKCVCVVASVFVVAVGFEGSALAMELDCYSSDNYFDSFSCDSEDQACTSQADYCHEAGNPGATFCINGMPGATPCGLALLRLNIVLPLDGEVPELGLQGDPVLPNGAFYYSETDASWPGYAPDLPVALTRVYRSDANYLGPMGQGFTHSYNERLSVEASLNGSQSLDCSGDVIFESGTFATIRFQPGLTVQGGIAQYWAEGSTLRLQYDPNAADHQMWRLRDGSGITRYFDADGNLSQIVDTGNNVVSVVWESHVHSVLHRSHFRVTEVIDTTGKSLVFNYSGDFVSCISLQDDPQCVDPLVSYTIDRNSASSTYGQLTDVWDADGRKRNHYEYGAPLTGTSYSAEGATTLCTRLCGRYVDSCHNFEVCAGGESEIAPPPGGDLGVLEQGLDVWDPLCNDGYCDRNYCIGLYSGNHSWTSGRASESRHNLIRVTDGASREVVYIEYELDRALFGYDRVVYQVTGADSRIGYVQGHEFDFEYHDLWLEDPTWKPFMMAEGWQFSKDPSPVNPLVTSRANFVPVDMCVEAFGNWEIDEADYPVQDPRYAQVFTDSSGHQTINHFDANWRLLRSWNRSTNEVTDYLWWPSGELAGVRNPLGDSHCFMHDANGHVVWSRSAPALSRPGNAQPIVREFDYDANDLLTYASVASMGSSTRQTWFVRDQYGRLKEHIVALDPANPNATLRTTLRYRDPTLPIFPADMNPTMIVSASGAETRLNNYDLNGGGPRQVVVDALNPAKLTYNYSFDIFGRTLLDSQQGFARNQRSADFNAQSLPWHTSYRNAAGTGWVSTEIHYDAGPQVDWMESPYVRVERRTDALGNVEYEKVIPRDGFSRTSATCTLYSGEGRPEQQLLREGVLVEWQYDGQNRVTRIRRGHQALLPTAGWASPCRIALGAYAPPRIDFGTVATFTYFPNGAVRTMRDGSGFGYDNIIDGYGNIIETRQANRVERQSIDAHGQVTWHAVYDAATAPAYRNPAIADAGLLSVVEYQYDGAGREIQRDTWHISGSPAAWVNPQRPKIMERWQYVDATNQVVYTDPSSRTQTTRYDGAGRPTQIGFLNGTAETRQYSADSKTVTIVTPGPTGGITTYLKYDELGLATRLTDANGIELWFEAHDAEGRSIEEREAGAAHVVRSYDSFGREYWNSQLAQPNLDRNHRLEWDRQDRLVGIVDARGNRTLYKYDGLDRLVEFTDPENRTTSWTHYAGSQNRRTETDPTRTISTFTMDSLGRTTQVSTVHGVGLAFAGLTTIRNFTFSPLGPMTRAEVVGTAPVPGLGTVVDFRVDSLGDTIYEKSSATPFEITRTHDHFLGSTTTNMGFLTLTHSRDPLGRLAEVRNTKGGISSSVALYTYGGGGAQPRTTVFGNGVNTTYGFDARGRLTTASTVRGTTAIASTRQFLGTDDVPRARRLRIGAGSTRWDFFHVDTAGAVIAENPRFTPPAATPIADFTAIDVTNTTVQSWIQSGTQWRNYNLDGVANWTTRTTNAGAIQPQHDRSNAMTQFGTTGLAYNARGDMTTYGTERYTYDGFGQIATWTKGTTTRTFAYDALGRRIWERDQTGKYTYFAYDGNDLAGWAATNATNNYTLRVGGDGVDEHVAFATRDAATGALSFNYYHRDFLGSTIAVTGPTGALREGYTYSAYGEPTIYSTDGNTVRSSTAIGNRLLYTGALHDPAMSAFSMRAREYIPALGQFTRRDPIGMAGGLNLFRYVGGRPTYFVDTWGTDPRRPHPHLPNPDRAREVENSARQRAWEQLNLETGGSLPSCFGKVCALGGWTPGGLSLDYRVKQAVPAMVLPSFSRGGRANGMNVPGRGAVSVSMRATLARFFPGVGTRVRSWFSNLGSRFSRQPTVTVNSSGTSPPDPGRAPQGHVDPARPGEGPCAAGQRAHTEGLPQVTPPGTSIPGATPGRTGPDVPPGSLPTATAGEMKSMWEPPSSIFRQARGWGQEPTRMEYYFHDASRPGGTGNIYTGRFTDGPGRRF